MNIKNLTLEDVIESIQSMCDDYGDFITMDCCDEILEKFYDQWDSLNEFHNKPSFIHNMTKDEAYFYYEILESITKKCIEKSLVESE